MGKDVKCALVDIMAEHGARPINEAVAFVAPQEEMPLSDGPVLSSGRGAAKRIDGFRLRFGFSLRWLRDRCGGWLAS
jgi:hypothetical protein